MATMATNTRPRTIESRRAGGAHILFSLAKTTEEIQFRTSQFRARGLTKEIEHFRVRNGRPEALRAPRRSGIKRRATTWPCRLGGRQDARAPRPITLQTKEKQAEARPAAYTTHTHRTLSSRPRWVHSLAKPKWMENSHATLPMQNGLTVLQKCSRFLWRGSWCGNSPAWFSVPPRTRDLDKSRCRDARAPRRSVATMMVAQDC